MPASGSFVETSPSLCGGRATAASTSVALISVPALHQAAGVELAVQLDEQRLGQAAFGECAAEATQHRLIRRAIVQTEAAEAPERQPVGQCFFKTGIGKLVPLRQQQRASRRQSPKGGKQRQRRVTRPPRRRAQRRKQAFHRRPVDQAGDAFQLTIGSRTRRQQRLCQARLPDPTLPPAPPPPYPQAPEGNRPQPPSASVLQRSPAIPGGARAGRRASAPASRRLRQKRPVRC